MLIKNKDDIAINESNTSQDTAICPDSSLEESDISDSGKKRVRKRRDNNMHNYNRGLIQRGGGANAPPHHYQRYH